MQANQTYSSLSAATRAPNTEIRLNSGWWIVPAVLAGLGFWVWALISLFT